MRYTSCVNPVEVSGSNCTECEHEEKEVSIFASKKPTIAVIFTETFGTRKNTSYGWILVEGERFD